MSFIVQIREELVETHQTLLPFISFEPLYDAKERYIPDYGSNQSMEETVARLIREGLEDAE